MTPETFIADTTRSKNARLRAVPIATVTLSDAFYEPRRALNRAETILSQCRHCETTNRLRNFARSAQAKPNVPFDGIFFNDSEVYKWLVSRADRSHGSLRSYAVSRGGRR